MNIHNDIHAVTPKGESVWFQRRFRRAEIFEANRSKAEQMEAPPARVFHMDILRIWDFAVSASQVSYLDQDELWLDVPLLTKDLFWQHL